MERGSERESAAAEVMSARCGAANAMLAATLSGAAMPSIDVVHAIARSESAFWISDGGPPAFRVADLRGPTGAEQADDPAAHVLRDFAADPGGAHDVSPTGWRVLARNSHEALFAWGELDECDLVLVERDSSGRWEWARSAHGVSAFQAIRANNPASSWRLDPAADSPTPASTELRTLVTEIHCASGQSAVRRVEPPDAFYGEADIRIVAYVTRLPGVQRCPGNPETPAVIVLPKPIGDRLLIDAGTYPPERRWPNTS
jgi:hypothetical protein